LDTPTMEEIAAALTDETGVNASYYDEVKAYFTQKLKESEETAIDQAKQEIVDLKRNISSFEDSIRDFRWQINDEQRKMKKLEEVRNETVDNFEAQFDALLRHNYVDALAIDGETLLIKTTPITMTNPDTMEELLLGELEISIPLVRRDVNAIKVINRTNARENNDGEVFQHPHINGTRPCFGAFENEIFTALAETSPCVAFEKMLMYLQTVNPEDEYGQNWSLWQD
jgi:chromosome segregation ATPase